MITVFNRETIYIGTDMKKFSQIRDILAQNDIDYKYSVKNQMNRLMGANAMMSSRTAGSFSELYEVFVHKKDYERAKYLLNQHNRQN